MHVAIEGIDGSGKTSFAHVLAAAFERAGKSVSLMDWFRDTAFRDIATRFNLNEKMTPEVLAAVQASSTLALLQRTEREPADVYLWDRYIYSSYASCTVRGADRALMRDIVELFPTPTLTILFVADPHTCYHRIADKRNGVRFYECGLDRLFRGRRREAQQRFEAQQISSTLVEEVFVDTMTEWNVRLQEIVPSEATVVLKDFDLSEAEAEANRIVERLFPPEHRPDGSKAQSLADPQAGASPELAEVMEFLAPREDYVVFGGVAGCLHTGIAHSSDVDVLVRDPETTVAFRNHFLRRAWLLKSDTACSEGPTEGVARVITLERCDMTLDICYYPDLVGPLFASCTAQRYEGRTIRIISPEVLLIMKLNHLTLDLPLGRTQRDREVIRSVRKKANLSKLHHELQSMSAKFWLQGEL